jgi:antitoxin (DNA-binding transcriptional repressor) of toxin-antitoxin stability system
MSIHQVNMHEAKSNLSRLASLASSGEKVIIAKSGKPFVELIPYVHKKKERTFGLLAEEIDLPNEFGELDEEIQEMFNV